MIKRTHALLYTLERSKMFWTIFLSSLVFFILRLPSLFEPNWYGDEGIYEVIGKAISEGKILYLHIWDNKPPLLYATYAVFHGDQFWARLLSLLFGLGAIITLFFLAKKLFKELVPTVIATGIFTILLGLPFLEGNIANAENFMLFPVILAGFICFTHVEKTAKNKPLFLAGILLGIAFLYKIVAIFDLAALATFLCLYYLPEKNILDFRKYLSQMATKVGLLVGGFLIPFAISCLYFLSNGGLQAYFQAIFFSTVGYVGYNNVLIIPQGLLIAKLILLVIAVLILLKLKKKLHPSLLFIFTWAAFSLFNSFFSQRPYTHYLLVLIPTFSLIAGSAFYRNGLRKISLIIACIIAVIGLYFFNHWSITKTVGFYTNFSQFVAGQKTLHEYQNFFDRRAPKDYEISRYINAHKKSGENIYIWGNSAQLYVMTDTLPPGRFTVAYHVGGDTKHLEETRKAIALANPQFIVVQQGMTMYPFSLYNYQHAITISENIIYERVR